MVRPYTLDPHMTGYGVDDTESMGAGQVERGPTAALLLDVDSGSTRFGLRCEAVRGLVGGLHDDVGAELPLDEPPGPL